MILILPRAKFCRASSKFESHQRARRLVNPETESIVLLCGYCCCEPHGGSEAAQEAAWRVVKGDISPSTTTSSAGIELDYDEYDHDGARNGHQRLDGRAAGSSRDAPS